MADLKSRLLFRGGIRSFQKVYPDETEPVTFYYKARTPNELASFAGSENVIAGDSAGGVLRQKLRAKFLAESLCNELGERVLTIPEAEDIPAPIKAELCGLIIEGSNQVGDAGKV